MEDKTLAMANTCYDVGCKLCNAECEKKMCDSYRKKYKEALIDYNDNINNDDSEKYLIN